MSPPRVPPNLFAAGFGLIVTLYFWWNNIKGIHESSGKALRIMQITTVMVVVFLIWCPLTMLIHGAAQTPPAPTIRNLHFSDAGIGWFKGTIWPTIPMVAIIIAFGHSLLSMSGFETLAQVYREIAYPKLKNLRITANIVCVYAVLCTGVVTLFAGLIIPDKVRGEILSTTCLADWPCTWPARSAAPRFPCVRGHCGRADSLRRRQYVASSAPTAF